MRKMRTRNLLVGMMIMGSTMTTWPSALASEAVDEGTNQTSITQEEFTRLTEAVQSGSLTKADAAFLASNPDVADIIPATVVMSAALPEPSVCKNPITLGIDGHCILVPLPAAGGQIEPNLGTDPNSPKLPPGCYTWEPGFTVQTSGGDKIYSYYQHIGWCFNAAGTVTQMNNQQHWVIGHVNGIRQEPQKNGTFIVGKGTSHAQSQTQMLVQHCTTVCWTSQLPTIRVHVWGSGATMYTFEN